jgi:hypothetical protein
MSCKVIFKLSFLIFRAFKARKKPLQAAFSVYGWIALKWQFPFPFQHEIQNSKQS